MKNLDWQMILFVGSSLAHDFWLLWGLPQVYFWDVKREYAGINNKKDNDKKIA